MTALAPRLTPLDERVLAALPSEPSEPSVRASVVAERVFARAVERRRSAWQGMRAQAERELRDVRGILRGLEHLGLATGRGGWWRRL